MASSWVLLAVPPMSVVVKLQMNNRKSVPLRRLLQGLTPTRKYAQKRRREVTVCQRPENPNPKGQKRKLKQVCFQNK